MPKVVAEVMRPIDDYTVEIVGYGSARPRVSVEIVPQVSGEVIACFPNCRSGMYITKREKLFQIDQTDATQARDSALRQIDLLQANLDRLDQERKNLLESEKLAKDRVALAVPGTALPNGVEIKKSKIRGEKSEGMLCAVDELGLGERGDGILILGEDAPVGEPAAGALGLGSAVLEVALLPDRGDCASLFGLAREVASRS